MVAIIPVKKRNRRIKELRDIPPPEVRIVKTRTKKDKVFKVIKSIQNISYKWAVATFICGKPNPLNVILEAFNQGIVFWKDFKGAGPLNGRVLAVRSPLME